jgi:hypothetical protein
MSFQRIRLNPKSFVIFVICNMLKFVFHTERWLVSPSNSKPWGPPFDCCPWLLIQRIRSCESYLENVPSIYNLSLISSTFSNRIICNSLFRKRGVYHCHSENSGYRSNKLSSIDTLQEWTSDQSFISKFTVCSGVLTICWCEYMKCSTL